MNKYFIIKQNYMIVGDVYKAYQRTTEDVVQDYVKKHNNCEIIFASPSQNAFIEKITELRKQGISVY